MPKQKTTPGARGTIWSEGIHNVWVDRKPARVRVPQYTIPETYQQFKDQITEDGGIQIGIDHIPEELLTEYPILKKLDPLNVGQITEVETDGSRIYATKSEHTNPLVAELYASGELTSYSVVAPMFADVDEQDDADYVFNKFKSIKRMDYVDEGGCTACKVDALPDNLILTAKLSMEVDNLTNEENTQNETEQTEETMENSSEETNIEQNEQEQEQQEIEEAVEPEYVTKEAFDTAIGELKTLLTEGNLEVAVESRIADLEKESKEAKLEARKAQITNKIDKKVNEGTIIPAMKEGLLQAGLSMKDEDFDAHLKTYKEKLWDPQQHAIEARNGEDGNFSMNDFQAARKSRKF